MPKPMNAKAVLVTGGSTGRRMSCSVLFASPPYTDNKSGLADV